MAPKMISSQQLLQELQDDNLFFDELVDMIPAKLYVAGNSGDDYNPKYFKGQAKESKEARRAKNKQAKRAKLDPSLSETTTQAKQRLEGRNRPLMPSAPTAAPPKNADPSTKSLPSTDSQSRIEALRAKLREKLAEKRGQRPSDPNVVSKRAARRAEKKKRQEEAAKRKKRATSQAEVSQAKKFRLDSTSGSSGNIVTDLANMDFGRLAGLNQSSNGNYQKANKSLANMSKTKNLQKMLADAEEKKKRLEELKHGTDEDKQKAENIQWGDTIKEASGERVKDDPAKLRKVLKRREAKKKKSAKAWKSRMENTKEKMDERQKIRSHNLNKRKLGGSAGANLSKKRIATEEDKAKNKSRPGFEGRKQGFLNNKKDQ